MHGDQTATVGENTFNLNQGDHVSNAVHYIALLEQFRAGGHHLLQRFAFAGTFQSSSRDQGYSLRKIQLQPLGFTLPATAAML